LNYVFAGIGEFESDVPREGIQLLKGGIWSNYDYWITDKKFLGFTSYMEAGVKFIGEKVSPVFVPSLGGQLGPLFNINYYNMPLWRRTGAFNLATGGVDRGAERGGQVCFQGWI